MMRALYTLTMVAGLITAVALAECRNSSKADGMTPALALGRLCLSEAGWNCWNTNDGLMIHEVLLRGAKRHSVPYETYARWYSRRVIAGTPRGPRPWIATLQDSDRQPVGFRFRWDGQYRELWMGIMDRSSYTTTNLTLDNVQDWTVCNRPVHDWGAPYGHDMERARRLGLIPVDCGDTRNRPWARPGLR